jgi:hypothetical protein
MRRKFFVAGAIWLLIGAATACALGTPSPTPVSGLPSPTPGGPTSEPTIESPTATGTVAPPTEASTAVPAGNVYAVVLVPEGGTVDAYTGAGSDTSVAGSLAWDAVNLQSTGNVQTIGGDAWVELNLPGGGTGWVDRKNLTEYMTTGAFCADSRVTALFTSFYSALASGDGGLLTPLVSPVHGLTVVYVHNGNPLGYTPAEAGQIFSNGDVVNWGLGPGSGLPVQGTFDELVRPDLLTVFGASYEPHCNTITLGGASYTVVWPAPWKNINFYSVYKPGSPGTEMDWMTWLAGVEYVDGVPYLFSLSRYNWEP